MLKVLFFISIFTARISLAQEVTQENGVSFLNGTCESIKAELKHFSQKKVTCQCEKDLCKVELTNYLPERIQEMLKVGNTVVDGPNCWNSVLFSLGANQTLRFSNNEMEYWIKSPLCEKRVGAPKPGDLINVSYVGEEKALHIMHTFQVLSPNISFNKTSPNKNHPYEIINRDEYFDRYLFSDDCRYVSIDEAIANKCEMIAEAYQCKNLDSALLNLDKTNETKKIKQTLQEIGECAQKGAMGEMLPWDDFMDISKSLQKLSLEKLGIPAVETTPIEIQNELNKFIEHNCQGCRPEDMTHWTEYIPSIYFYATPQMKLNEFPPLLQKTIQLAREKHLYSKLSLEDTLMWTNVYLSAESLHGQFEILKYPED